MADEEQKTSDAEVSEDRIPIIWESAEDLPTLYVNQIIVSHSGPEFYMIFGEVITPAIQGQIGGDFPDTLKVKPIIKVAIPQPMMLEITDIIVENVKKFMEKHNIPLE